MPLVAVDDGCVVGADCNVALRHIAAAAGRRSIFRAFHRLLQRLTSTAQLVMFTFRAIIIVTPAI